MALLTITTCRVVRQYRYDDIVVGEALPEGDYARQNTTTGKLELGKATNATEVGVLGGIVTDKANAVGEVAHIVFEGLLDVGDALSALTFGDTVYLSDTDGQLADAAGTVTTAIVGTVVPAYGAFTSSTTADKLLYFTGIKP